MNDPASTPPSHLRIAQSHVRLDDPHLCNDDSNSLAVQAALHDTLVVRDAYGTFQPALARRYDVSDDARTWTIELRPDARFHDGTDVTSEDVLATLERVRDPSLPGVLGTEGVYASYLEGARYEATGRHALRIQLERPLGDLLDLLVDFPVTPAGGERELTTRPVGAGPYRLVEGDEARVVLERSPHRSAADGEPERVTFIALRDALERRDAVREGIADLAAGIPPELRVRTSDDAPHVIRSRGSLCAVFFFNLNGSDSKPYRDPRVRRALNHAVDRSRIIREALAGEAEPLSGPFTPLHDAYDPTLVPHAYDRDRARALLAEAGFASGLELTLDVPTRLPDEATVVAELLREAFGEVGVEVSVRSYDDRPAYANMVRAKRIHDLACFDSGPVSSYRVLVEKFHSAARGPWWQGYENADVDALIDRAAQTAAPALRRSYGRAVTRILHDDAPWLYLYTPTKAWIANDSTRHWRPSFTGVTRP